MIKRTVANRVSPAAPLFAFLIRRGKLQGHNPIKGGW
jgi:hypothetical protein